MQHQRSQLIRIFKEFCDNYDIDHGLLLVDLPTGFGKTYSAMEYIVEKISHIDEEEKKGAKTNFGYIFFITSLKKNLPFKELQEHFRKAGREDLFAEKFLLLESNADSLVTGMTDEVIRKIPYEITDTDLFQETQKLVSRIQSLRRKRKQNGGLSESEAEFLKDTESRLSSETEPQFRRMISRKLRETFRTSEKRYEAVCSDPAWKWIGRLYPGVYMRDRQVIFLSVDKFLLKNDTITVPSSSFITEQTLKNSIVFIDEFDATKEKILHRIIDDSLKETIDSIELFRSLYAALHMSEFPEVLTNLSGKDYERGRKEDFYLSRINELKKVSDEIFQDYRLLYPHKTVDDMIDTAKNFLFQDRQFHSVFDAKKKFLQTVPDEARKQNVLSLTDERPGRDNSLTLLLDRIMGFLKKFETTVLSLAAAYLEKKEEQRKPMDDDFTHEQAVRSVLKEFSLSDPVVDYIASSIMNDVRRKNSSSQNFELNPCLYDRGFRYFSFIDDPDHDMRSSITMTGFNQTPEKILLKICSLAKVVGISATATVPSVTGNYDLGYLRRKLGPNYITLSDADRELLEKEFTDRNSGYADGRVRIETELISPKDSKTGKYQVSCWNKVFSNEEYSEKAFNMVAQSLPDGRSSYDGQRYLKICMVYRYFLEHQDIRSMLCMLNKHPGENDPNLNRKLLKELFRMIARDFGPDCADISPEKTVCYLRGDEYEHSKDVLLDDLASGQKRLVISVYQTIGAGQNLQYSIPDDCSGSVIRMIEDTRGGKKDFGAIYLDKPTHVIQNLNEPLTEEQFAEALFQIEYLKENGELSNSAADRCVKTAFAQCFHQNSTEDKKYWNSCMYRCRSVRLQSSRTLMQAVGRICRTSVKNSTVYVLADRDIGSMLDPSIGNDRMLNPEYKSLIDKFREEFPQIDTGIPSEKDHLKILAQNISEDINRSIHAFLRLEWTEARMLQWTELRRKVLANPTCNGEKYQSDDFIQRFWIQLPEKSSSLWYGETGDHEDVQVYFQAEKPIVGGVLHHESEQNSRLTDFMKIPGIRQYFEEKGYATSFSDNEYMMAPTTYTNIYKGALGEEVGRFILEREMNIRLAEITDPKHYEKFDFIVEGTDIYMDFKNWSELTEKDNEKMVKQIAQKAKDCSASCVLVINILAEHDYSRRPRMFAEETRIVEIPSLYLKQSVGQLNADTVSRKIIREEVESYGCTDFDK